MFVLFCCDLYKFCFMYNPLVFVVVVVIIFVIYSYIYIYNTYKRMYMSPKSINLMYNNIFLTVLFSFLFVLCIKNEERGATYTAFVYILIYIYKIKHCWITNEIHALVKSVSVQQQQKNLKKITKQTNIYLFCLFCVRKTCIWCDFIVLALLCSAVHDNGWCM